MVSDDFKAGREFQALENRLNELASTIRRGDRTMQEIEHYAGGKPISWRADEYNRALFIRPEFMPELTAKLEQYKQMVQEYHIPEHETAPVIKNAESVFRRPE